MSKFEQKFAVVPVANNEYVGKHPLSLPAPGARGVYGGEIVCQAIEAAWNTIPGGDFSPHSLHGYFVKAGSTLSPVVWKVQELSNSRNYANRLVQGFQQHTGDLIYSMQTSFVRNNSAAVRDKIGHKNGLKPYSIQSEPHKTFYQYKDRLDEIPDFKSIAHTQVKLPKEFGEADFGLDLKKQGKTSYGFFLRVTDDISGAKNPVKAQVLSLLYLSDLIYLGALGKGLGLPFVGGKFNSASFFRVSLDHSVFIHENNFDPTQWIFIEYQYSVMHNDRVLCTTQLYDMSGSTLASVVQEALAYFPEQHLKQVQYQLDHPEPSTAESKL